jgi:hypothetical protein
MDLGGEENAGGIRRPRSMTYRMISESLAWKGESQVSITPDFRKRIETTALE